MASTYSPVLELKECREFVEIEFINFLGDVLAEDEFDEGSLLLFEPIAKLMPRALRTLLAGHRGRRKGDQRQDVE